MYQIHLKNNKYFSCDKGKTILNAATSAGLVLEHSCLTARCRSCVVKVLEGTTENIQQETVLSEYEKQQNFVLSCNAKPTSNLSLDIEDVGDIEIYEKKIIPVKISGLEKITKDVIKVSLRFPPTADFKFISGQYVNLIKGTISRSYSVANNPKEKNSSVDFFIKKYQNGLMSKYWFEEAKQNDLLRLEGPLGSFFFRESNVKDIIFLATGTGITPVKSILEQMEISSQEYNDKRFWVLVGARHEEDFFWEPKLNGRLSNLKYIPVLSRPKENWTGEKGYVQEILLKQNVDLENAQVYACGSNQMIESAKTLLTAKSLPENQFFSDAFVCTN